MSNKKSRLKKRRRRSIIAFEMIRLDRTANEPLHQQLYRQIRDELRSGSFSDSSSRLPSSRALATDLGISRLTVNCILETSCRRLSPVEGRIRNICCESPPRNLFDCGPTERLSVNPASNSYFRSCQSDSR
jgi:DNA-binding transcriptional MocR family regulator